MPASKPVKKYVCGTWFDDEILIGEVEVVYGNRIRLVKKDQNADQVVRFRTILPLSYDGLYDTKADAVQAYIESLEESVRSMRKKITATRLQVKKARSVLWAARAI